jgi:hypothetical protein
MEFNNGDIMTAYLDENNPRKHTSDFMPSSLLSPATEINQRVAPVCAIYRLAFASGSPSVIIAAGGIGCILYCCAQLQDQ